jgi:parallel beta-helix repeat protein
MRGRWVILLSVFAAASAASATLALQALGTATTAISCGMTVTTSITADNDLTNCAGIGLLVGANGITINLNGHTVDGDDAGTEPGIDNTGGFDQVTIENGRITDFNAGVHLVGALQNELTGLEVRSNLAEGILIGSSGMPTISGNRILENALDGLSLTSSSGGKVEGNRIVANGMDGIDTLFADSNKYVANTISLNGEDGIENTGNANTLDGNVVARNGGFGIGLIGSGANSNIVKGNRVVRNGAAGVEINSGNENALVKNLISGNGTEGIRFVGLPDDTLVKQNELIGNGDDGVEVKWGRHRTERKHGHGQRRRRPRRQ